MPPLVIADVLLGTETTNPAQTHDILVDGDRIVDVSRAGTRRPEGAELLDGSGLIAFPGLINGHYHSHESFQKGRYEGLPLELWMNLVRPMKPIPLTAEEVYLRTMVGAIEALHSGTTTIVDDMNVSPLFDQSHVDAAFRAYEDAGIRAYVGTTLFDRPFFRGVPFVDETFPPDLLAALEAGKASSAEEILAFARTLARDKHPETHRVGFIVAPSAPQRCTEDFLRATRQMADEFALPAMIHVHETRQQVVTGEDFFGSSMIAYLERIGFLKPHTTIIHGVWVTDADLDIIAKCGASVQHNPNSNLKLGSGLMPMREMLDRGINVSLGTDGCGSIESVDMLRNLANTSLLQNLRDVHHSRWITAAEAFASATTGGAKALGRQDLGRIAPGMKADFALYDRHGTAFTPLNNAVRQFVYAETGRGLRHVVVDGAVVLRDGTLVSVDEEALLRKVQAAAERLEDRIRESEAGVARMRRPYEQIFDRCCAQPIPAGIHPVKVR